MFADRAQLADPHFALDAESEPVVARIVARLDGMPLAIELAAARVEALGVAQLLERLDDRFVLLTGSNRLAPGRQRSLAATVQWSYELLSEPEQKVFRQLAVFPGPFTLEAAEAVAGADAALTVMHLVECSLLTSPRTGPDGRARYGMLETLRAYGADRLSQAGEYDTTAARLAAYALRVAEEAAAQLDTSVGELGAARWLDAEDAAVHQGALAWQRRVRQLDPSTLPPRMIRSAARNLAFALMDAGDYGSAMTECKRALTLLREAGDLAEQAATLMRAAHLDLLENDGMALTARPDLREAIEIAFRVGTGDTLLDCLDVCALLCAQTQRSAEAIVLWTVYIADMRQRGISDSPQELRRREGPLQEARQALGPAATQAAEDRGAAMNPATAAEFALLLLSEDPHHPQPQPRAVLLTPREQELVTLVARGTTDAQIAAQLYISVRTVRSHLDRIRDKTGCRRRADLTRLALTLGLV